MDCLLRQTYEMEILKNMTKQQKFAALFGAFLLIKIAIIAYAKTVFFYSPSWIGHLYVDLWGWLDFFKKSHEGLIPYVDFSKEYPVGAGLLYWVMSFFIPYNTHQTVPFVHSIFMFCADALGFILFYKIAEKIFSKRAFFATCLFGLNFTALILSPVRFESYVTLTVLAGFLCHLNKKPRWATFWWALGCSMKWYPLFFIAARDLRALFIHKKWRPLIESAGITVLVIGAINLPFILVSLGLHGNIDQWWSTYAFHLNRPLYWDTLLGVGQMWWGTFDFEVYASYWTLALVCLALFLKPKMPVEAKGVLICIAAIIFNRVYSTQFHLWFYPFLILFAMQQTERVWKLLIGVFLVLDMLNVFVYPFSFTYALMEMKNFGLSSAAQRGGVWTVLFSLAIFMRTLVLAYLVFIITQSLRKPVLRRM
jgi:hypothetical protein